MYSIAQEIAKSEQIIIDAQVYQQELRAFPWVRLGQEYRRVQCVLRDIDLAAHRGALAGPMLKMEAIAGEMTIRTGRLYRVNWLLLQIDEVSEAREAV